MDYAYNLIIVNAHSNERPSQNQTEHGQGLYQHKLACGSQLLTVSEKM